MKTFYLVSAFLFLFTFPTINTFAQDVAEISAAEKMTELEWLIGKWKHEGTWLPTGDKIDVRWDCDWLFAQTTIQCKYFETPDTLSQIAFWSYDSDLQDYVTVSYVAEFGPMKGSFIKNGETWSIQVAITSRALKSWNHAIYTPKGDTIDLVMFRSTNGAKIEKVQEAVITKIK